MKDRPWIQGTNEDETSSNTRKRSWFSGNLAQFMVFLNGLILAVTAYLTLNIFIQEMLQDDFQYAVSETQEIVSENLFELENSIKAVSTFLTVSDSFDSETLKKKILYAAPHVENFDRIFWVKKNSTGNLTIQDLFAFQGGGDAQPLVSKGSEQSFVHFILANMATSGNEVVIVTGLPGTRQIQEYNEPLVRGRPFALAVPVTDGQKNAGIVIGLTRVTSVLDKSWLDKRGAISRINIRDTNSGRQIFFMDREPGRKKATDILLSEDGFEFHIGEAVWQMKIELGQDRRTAMLEYAPALMLLFGITLTLIGTLFVRNNQKQSYKLASMNKALAQKNYELSNEAAERERLNLFLRKAEGEYKAIIDAVSDIIFEANAESELLFLNETWKKITGFDTEQSLNRSLFDMLHPQDQDEQRESFGQLLKGQKYTCRAFTRLRTSDGTFRSVELAMSVLRQDDNRNIRIVGTITDVEERRRAERALSEAEKKYRTIVENAAGGIYQVTPEGQFLSANPAMARILGYDTPEQILREVRDAHKQLYVNNKDRRHFIRELETKGVITNFETQLLTRDKQKIWISKNARVVKDDEGSILYYEGSMAEITKRKEAEIDLQKAKTSSDLASRAKSEFLANMSHELRTPLNAIIGFSEIIKNEVMGPIENRQYWEYAGDIYESGKSLLTIINEILDVSRIEAGERHLNDSIVDLEKIVKSCIEFMEPKAEANEMTINNLMDTNVPQIIGEELAIKQILLNLLSNAIKFTPTGGRVTLSHELDKEGRLRLSVTDTGVGLDEEEIEKALSPFGQIENSFSRSSAGAGLGLTLVNSLVKLHGGRLELFSQKGIGTTATIILPAKRVAQEEGEKQAEGEGDDEGQPRKKGDDFPDDYSTSRELQ